MVAKSVVAPVDRIKILFQVSSEPFSLRKVLTIMRRIHREEGLAGLWKGNSATMLRCVSFKKSRDDDVGLSRTPH